MWDLSCPDWEDRIRAGKSLIPDLPLLTDTARHAVSIFNMLRLPDVSGIPTNAEASGDWLREIVAALFGSYDPDTAERMIREIFWLVPKKNNKTTGGAEIMLTATLLNTRPRAEFFFVAPTQALSEQAYSQAVGAIEADDTAQREQDGNEGFLKKRFHVQDHKKTIIDRRTKAKLQIKTYDVDIITGQKVAGCLLDEVHLLGKMHGASKVLRQIRGGMLPIPEAFLVMISTQSDEQPAGVFKAELETARMIRDGKIQGNTLPIIYEFPPKMVKNGEWEDPKNWWMVTPNRDRSINIKKLIQLRDEARQKGDDEYRVFASQHLNIEIGLALSSDSWAGAEFWEACADKTLTLEELIRRSEVAVVGIDGGGLDDLLGLCVIGRERGTRKLLVWVHAWAHRIVLQRRKEIEPRLQDFERAGELSIIDDDSDEDVQGVVRVVEQLEKAGLLPEHKAIGVDPVGVNDIVDALELAEFSADPETGRIIGIKQGWTLSNTIKTAERRLAAKDIVHSGAAIAAWSVGNAKPVPRGNAVSIEKQTSGKAKIDPLMAFFNAIALISMNPKAKVAPQLFLIA